MCMRGLGGEAREETVTGCIENKRIIHGNMIIAPT